MAGKSQNYEKAKEKPPSIRDGKKEKGRRKAHIQFHDSET